MNAADGGSDSGPLLEAHDLVAGYLKGIDILRGCFVEVGDGELVGVIGPNGAGKSTLLAAIALQCATAGDADDDGDDWSFLAAKLPLFLHVADLEAASWPADAAGLAHALPVTVDRLNRSTLAKIVEERLAAGTALLLLDGADELLEDQQPALVDWLRGLLDRYPLTQVVMAGPTSGYAALLELEFTLSGIMPWRGGNAELFGRRWADALKRPVMPLRRYWQPGQLPWHTVVSLQSLRELEDQSVTSLRWTERAELALRSLLPAADDDPPWLAPVCRDWWQQLARTMIEGRHRAGF